jgi:soluble lytic murein transglycosylase
MTLKKQLALLAFGASLGLGASVAAHASEASDLLGARDAYRQHKDDQLALYARQLDGSVLGAYPRYWLALRALDRQDSLAMADYLARETPSILTEKARAEWLKWLARTDQWTRFGQELAKQPEAGRDDEIRCDADLWQLSQGKPSSAPDNRFLDSRALTDGCLRLLGELGRRKLVTPSWLLARVHLLEAGGNLTQARTLAAQAELGIDAAFDPRLPASENSQASEATLLALLARLRSDPDGVAARLQQQEGVLGPERAQFLWGQLALAVAKRQSASQAQQWFAKSDPKQLTQEQWEWWARSALRNEQWSTLESITASMPANVAAMPAWRYWRARALKALGRAPEATPLFAEASRSTGFYGVLAQEELGNTLETAPPANKPAPADFDHVSSAPSVKRARMLLDIADRLGRPELRTDAQREWKWAMRERPDIELLAAAELARRDGWYDIAIDTAERTKEIHDFSLRYLAPYRDITERYATQLGVDQAWVYGLIRQESRFVTAAHSGVGASGLMQLMPSTARWVARKVGLGAYAVNNIDTNIQLGTWYLRYVLQNLGHPVLATAAYNAGPARARAWQAGRPLEGAIYAETIPFTETRDYVKKVMANAAYYASSFGHTPLALKARLGVIAAQ